MPDYKSMYFHLAGRIAGAIDSLEAVLDSLKLAQQTTEEMFMSAEDHDEDM